MACHAANETVQLNQLRRWYEWSSAQPKEAAEAQVRWSSRDCPCLPLLLGKAEQGIYPKALVGTVLPGDNVAAEYVS